MSFIDKIKFLFKLNAVFETERKAIKTMDIKDGWKTSEFWGKVAAQAGIIWAAVGGFVPPKYAAIIVAAAEICYGGVRGALKMVHLVQATKANTETVTTTAPVTTVTTPT